MAEIIKRTTIIKTATRHFLTQQMGLVSCICTKEVYMKQLEGFSSSDGEHLVCKLKKSIYGLKQALRQWYLKFNDVIFSFGFVENAMD